MSDEQIKNPRINGHPFQAGMWIMHNGEQAELFAVRGQRIFGTL